VEQFSPLRQRGGVHRSDRIPLDGKAERTRWQSAGSAASRNGFAELGFHTRMLDEHFRVQDPANCEDLKFRLERISAISGEATGATHHGRSGAARSVLKIGVAKHWLPTTTTEGHQLVYVNLQVVRRRGTEQGHRNDKQFYGQHRRHHSRVPQAESTGGTSQRCIFSQDVWPATSERMTSWDPNRFAESYVAQHLLSWR
jgi:hypothetical protein